MRLATTPLRVQLAVGFSLLLSLLFVFAFSAVNRDARASLYQTLDRDLVSLARSEVSSAIDGPNEGPHFHASGAQQGVLFQPDGMILAATKGLSPTEARALTTYGLQVKGAILYESSGLYRVITLDTPLDGLPQARLVLRLPLEPVLRNLADLRSTLILWGVCSTLVGTGAAWLLAVRLTRPLERVAALAGRVRQGKRGERLAPSRESSEVHLLQTSLNQMLDELELRAKQQRQFVADASHELRNPLHALQGTLEVARRRTRPPEEYQEAIDVALTETRRLTRLVEDLLSLSRADLERLELQCQPVDLLELLDGCRQAHNARAAQRGLLLSLEGKPIVWPVDADRLRQVIDNLVDNALRHSPPNGAVQIRLREQDGCVLLEVLDQGESLETEEYERIFERFSRLDPSRQRPSGGLGLGLAIARALVEAHGGKLQAQALAGGGSRFFLTLPAPSPNSHLSPVS